jgi:hypothetical protein
MEIVHQLVYVVESNASCIAGAALMTAGLLGLASGLGSTKRSHESTKFNYTSYLIDTEKIWKALMKRESRPFGQPESNRPRK